MKQGILIFLAVFFVLFANAKKVLVRTAEEATAALKVASPGDSVVLANGLYRDVNVHFTAKGTDKMPVVFMSEMEGKVVFEGNSRLSFSGAYVVVNVFVWQHGGGVLEKSSVIEFRTSSSNEATYSVLQNCIVNEFNNANKSIDNKWVSLFGQYNTVKNCLLKGKDNLGATLTVWLKEGIAAHHTIAYNYFLDRPNGPDVDNGLESIRIGDSKTSLTDSYCKVAFYLFEACVGEMEIISNKSGQNSYYGNTFYNSNGGLTLRDGNGAVCEGIFFWREQNPILRHSGDWRKSCG